MRSSTSRLHPLPDGVAVRADDHRAPHRAVVGQLGLGDDVLVPAGEVLGLRGEHGSLGHGPRCYGASGIPNPLGLLSRACYLRAVRRVGV